jgi:chromosome segregation ATPase
LGQQVNPKIEELKELLQQVSDDKEALERKFMHLQEQYTQLEQDMLNDKEALETELNREKQVAQTLRVCPLRSLSFT